jgi:hypothetical protein
VKPPMAGWIVFAAIVMLVVGMLDFFEGLIAIIRGEYYVIHGSQLIVFDTTTWGWITMIWGIVLFLAGLALWGGSGWARWLTIVLVGLNTLAQLKYPLWSLVIVALNIIVLFALTARWHGYPEEARAT